MKSKANKNKRPMPVGSGAVLGVPSLTLTVREIKDLAEFSGLRVSGDWMGGDDLETEITIEVFPKKGVKDDDGKILVGYRHLAYLDEYPEEGCVPLGTPNEKS